jgi:hypothetical protein
VIYTEPLIRYAVANGVPVIESSVWVYAPGNPRAVGLPHELFSKYAATLIETFEEVAANLEEEYQLDLLVWEQNPTKLPHPVKPNDQTVVNEWVPVDISNWLMAEDPNGSLDIFNLKPAKGVKFVTESVYLKALAELEERQAAEELAYRKSAIEHRANEYDSKAQRYRKLGWDDDDIVAEFGPRPSIEDLV